MPVRERRVMFTVSMPGDGVTALRTRVADVDWSGCVRETAAVRWYEAMSREPLAGTGIDHFAPSGFDAALDLTTPIDEPLSDAELVAAASTLRGLAGAAQISVLSGSLFRSDAPPSAVGLWLLLRRRPDLDRDGFRHYWSRVHSALAFPPIDAFSQTGCDADDASRIAQLCDVGALDVDGVAAPSWDDVAGCRAFYDTPFVRAEGLADERNFIDHARSPATLATTHDIRVPGAA